MTWIQTYSGKRFDYLQPEPDAVCIEDIARALSMSCRFNGHVKAFYSIAQHSVLVSEEVPKEYAFEALLHDAHEAYVGDVVRPLKELISGVWQPIEDRVQAAICQRFGVPFKTSPPVKEADMRALVTESNYVLGAPPVGWSITAKPFARPVIACSAAEAERLFLRRFYELMTGA